MSLVLGDGWPAPVVLPDPDPADMVLERVLLAVQALQATFAALPVPQVTVEPQDLSDIVTAVQSLHGPAGPDAAEIAAAVRDALSPLAQAAPESSAVLTELAAALKQLDFRMQGIGAGGTGGTVATISNDVAVKPAAGTTAFPVTVLSGTIDTGAPALTGTWGYKAGVSGTPALPAQARVLAIAAHATTAASLSINAGDSIPIPAQTGWGLDSVFGQLVGPTLVFTGTDSYVVAYLT